MRTGSDKTLAALLLMVSVGVAMYSPAVANIFAPLMLPSLFFIVLFSLLPYATQRDAGIFHLRFSTVCLVIWQQFIVPAIVLGACLLLKVDEHLTKLMLVTATAGSLFASPIILQLLNLDSRTAIQSIVLSTLTAPFAIYLFLATDLGGHAELDVALFLQRVAMFLIVPLGLFILLRELIQNRSGEMAEKINFYSRWGAVISLAVFGCAIMDDIDRTIENDPGKLATFFFAALIVTIATGLLTRLTMARFGRSQALTGSILSSFRNTGLSLALIGDMIGPDLAVYVGISQLPVFLAPLFLDVFLEKKQESLQASLREKSKWDQLRGAFETFQPPSGVPNPLTGGRISAQFSPAINQQSGNRLNTGPDSAGIYALDNGSAAQTSSGSNGDYRLVTAGSTALAAQVSEEADSASEFLSQPPRRGRIEENLSEITAAGLTEGGRAVDLIARLQNEYETARDEASRLKAEQRSQARYSSYVFGLLLVFAIGCLAVWEANKRFAPMLYDMEKLEEVADAHTRGLNYGVFDLNIDIRNLRNAEIARMKKAPELVVLGASQWQEGHVSLLPEKDFYNSHIHRDYYEDMLAMTEMYIRHNKLPDEMIITIRDNLFTPVKDRTDFLWLPGIPYYRAMANRLGIEPHSRWETAPVQTWRELISLPFLWVAAKRELTAPQLPLETKRRNFKTLDTLLPGGSILWAADHKEFFSQDRSEKESLAFAEKKRVSPPKIDPKGVEHIDILLKYLTDRGVKVTLAHPPFNPIFWEAVQGSEYMDGLERVKNLTKSWAEKYDLSMIGSFNPHDLGCRAEMYIDAEHSSPECLGKILNQYAALDGPQIRQTLPLQLGPLRLSNLSGGN